MKPPKIFDLIKLSNILPEIISLISVLSLIFVLGEVQTSEVVSLIFLLTIHAITFRLVWQSAIIVHGLGHSLAIALMDRNPLAISPNNILEHRNFGDILKSLIPFQQIINLASSSSESVFDIQFPYLDSGEDNHIRIKALGGIIANLIVILGCYCYPKSFFSLNFILANSVIILSSLSDIQALFTGKGNCLYCGNFGLIAKRFPTDENILLPSRMLEIVKQMGRETEIRGEQAGGGLVMGKKDQKTIFVGKKIVNKKRHNLTQTLESAFGANRSRAIKRGIKPLYPSVIGAWHYRYATSGSAPSELETHWHQWMQKRENEVWQFRDQQWQSTTKNVNHAITHNGDFSSWQIFGQDVEYKNLGWWLERVLHTPNSTQGDSPKIAGMIDLLVTQGMWYPSVRLAYQQTIAKSLAESFGGQNPSIDAPNTAPSIQELKSWAEVFRQVFLEQIVVQQKTRGVVVGRPKQKKQEYGETKSLISLTDMQPILQRLFASNSDHAKWTEQATRDFINATLRAFMENDLHRATQIFISQATGSFGLVVTSTLEESNLVLCAKGQPISIGFNCQQDYMIYASEPAAINRIILNQPESFRLDLDTRAGEVAKVGIQEINIYSLEKQKELTALDLEPRWISMTEHPHLSHIKLAPPVIKDPVSNDLHSIPQVFEEIKTSWQNADSLNRRSADYLVQLLTKKVQRLETRQKLTFETISNSNLKSISTVDLLITGEESSLWLGEKFAQDLTTIFPLLNISTVSANKLLNLLEYDRERLNLGKDSLVLAITQSGQTFSTSQVISIFDHLSGQEKIEEVFILTGELSSFINFTRGKGGLSIINDSTHLKNDFDYCYRIFHRYRIFVNGSGRRTAEPNTLSVAAATQTLTELLLYISEQMRANYPDAEPLGMTLSKESLAVLSMMKEDFLDKNVLQIIGTDSQGESLFSKTADSLVKSGINWANHVTETPLSWAIQAIYIIVSVGWAIPFGHSLPLVKSISGLIFNLIDLPMHISKFLSPLITITDILVYIFGAWLWILFIRFCQGRELFARIGKRTITIADVSWVHQLLEAYISKLFALSYGIASVDVHSENSQNHFLHAFGHRVVRGTLVWLGVPDGRRSNEQKAAERASLMTGKQANGIRNFQVGAEIVALGHNPKIVGQGFSKSLVLPSNNDTIYYRDHAVRQQKEKIERLRESCFGSFERLLASYVFFWALAKRVASFPLLKYQYWKSQSRTKVMTTASPVEELDVNKLTTNNSLAHYFSGLLELKVKKK